MASSSRFGGCDPVASLQARVNEALRHPECAGWELISWVKVRPGEPTTGQLRLQAATLQGRYLQAVQLAKGEWPGQPLSPLQAAWCLRDMVVHLDGMIELPHLRRTP